MSSKRHHAEWLSLIDVSGPFLTLPVLERVFPQGLDGHDPEQARTFRLAYGEWGQNQQSHRPHPAMHQAWVKFVLQQTLAFPDEVLSEGQAIPPTLRAGIAEHGEVLRPDVLIRHPAHGPQAGQVRLLLQTYPCTQGLEKPVVGRHWKASPATRMMELLHATDVRLGLVTNGEQWMLVYAPRGETTGFASWYASLWGEEPLTLRAFRSLLGVQRFFAVPDDETLEAMLAESATHQQDVTDQLGWQVRRAVEVLVQSLDRADQDHRRDLLADVPETVLYEAVLTVMMRLVFLFSAEERGLLLLGDPLYDQYYAVSTLVAQLQEAADQHGEEVLERRLDAWVRLLATFRAVYGGVQHDRMQLPAYAGNLFNPDRFPFLEGRKPGTTWQDTPATPLPVDNCTVLHLLRSLQYLEMHGEARRLSFRALDIEQIGHVYEGLLDHTARRAAEPVLGLIGTKSHEPEVPLAELEQLKDKSETALMQFLQDATGRSASTLRRALALPLSSLDANRLRAVCGNDDALLQRVRPFAGLVRNDPFDHPMVIRQGSVYVTAGTDRRSSGTHYTPRSLTEPIVQYTLEPLVYLGPAEGKPREGWKLRAARDLLELKIGDMACGSGAFLVQVCRYLSERLVEAWEQAEEEHPGVPGITPEGTESTGAVGELLIPTDPDERLVYAYRIVAQRCVYGVDNNPLAVEMAKLSLWLLTLAKDKPFTFLDHAVRCGDSLVGITDLDQIKYFNLAPQSADQGLFTGPILALANEAVALRKKIESNPSNTVEDVAVQQKLLVEAEAKTSRLRCLADLLLSVDFQPSSAAVNGHRKSATPRGKDTRHTEVAIRARDYITSSTLEEFQAVAKQALHGQPTFHWPLEFPEVMLDRGGYDAFVCNPPFMGGQNITGNLSTVYRDYLVTHLAHGKRGSADLCAYFFLRAKALLRQEGHCGFLATNTIAQGDTREVGLEQLTKDDRTMPRAVSSQKWPGTANVDVAIVWGHRGPWQGDYTLDAKPASGITSYLTMPGEVTGNPYRLAANADKSFIGSYVLGMGFVLTPEEAQALIDKDHRNRDVLFPYLNGEDLNSRPDQSPSRWVINFFNWPLCRGTKGSWTTADEQHRKDWLRTGIVPDDYPDPVAADYPNCLAIVEEKVKPERQKLNRKIRRERWWQFAERAPALNVAIAGLEQYLIHPLTSKCHSLFFCAHGIVASHMTVVLSFDTWGAYCVLQCELHWKWVWEYGNKLGNAPQYTPTDCFETYPFPKSLVGLDAIGESYYVYRRQIMLTRQEGLTKTYNRFHDPDEAAPDIQKLRELHILIDRNVATAYGWTDLDLDHGFHETKQGLRFTISESARREVLARLLKLNHERYAEEVKQGLHDKGKTKSNGTKRCRSKVGIARVSSLFDTEENAYEVRDE